MIGPITITEQQATDNLEFCLDLTESQRVCWRIVSESGKSVMMVPVNELPPIPEDIQKQVEEFREQFKEDNAT